VEAVRGGNSETGGRLIEFGGTEYMVRGRGYAKSLQDFENIVLSASETGTPIRIRDIGRVTIGPDLRRGVTDLDGEGELAFGLGDEAGEEMKDDGVVTEPQAASFGQRVDGVVDDGVGVGVGARGEMVDGAHGCSSLLARVARVLLARDRRSR
jgi:hypothetical protein